MPIIFIVVFSIFVTKISLELASEKGDIKRKRVNVKTAFGTASSQNIQAPIRIETTEIEKPRSTHSVLHTRQVTEKVASAEVIQPLSRHDPAMKSLLFIREGRCISNSSNGQVDKPANCYLVCRMFWDEKASRSKVVWNSLDPEFNFIQVSIWPYSSQRKEEPFLLGRKEEKKGKKNENLK